MTNKRRPSPKKEYEQEIYEMHAQVCSVFSNPKRLQIINLLRDGEETAGALARRMGITKANISQQLAVLKDRGILASRRDGQRIYYRLAFPKMLVAYDLLREVLVERLKEQGALAARIAR